MKRLIPALLCIFAALALAAGSYLYVKTRTEELGAAMEKVLESADPFSDALSLCEKWKTVRVTFGSLLKHSDADELGKYFMLIEAHAVSRQKEKLLDDIESCRTALRVILEGEKPGAANIF